LKEKQTKKEVKNYIQTKDNNHLASSEMAAVQKEDTVYTHVIAIDFGTGASG
jgi:hypothetical protein